MGTLTFENASRNTGLRLLDVLSARIIQSAVDARLQMSLIAKNWRATFSRDLATIDANHRLFPYCKSICLSTHITPDC